MLMRKTCAFILFVSLSSAIAAQTKPDTASPLKPVVPAMAPFFNNKPSEPKPYKDVITVKAKTKKGLFTVHKVEEKYYFEIADSVFGREIMAVTRFSKVAGGGGVYGGEVANQQTIRWEKGPDNKIFLRVLTLLSVTEDSTESIFKAVRNSYLDPIAAAFDIKAFSKDSSSVVIDVTDFFKGDNQVVSIDPSIKRRLSLSALSPDRTYIQTINTYPINTEIKTVKTYSSSSAGFGFPGIPTQGRTLPAADAAGAVTIEMNTSFVILPVQPMRRRKYDNRVGYFTDDVTLYDDHQQRVNNERFIVRWRLEPKPEDAEKFKRGELVEPAKPIVYYIDPATPKQWRKYLIAGINDWQKAFEQAGFKNAIIGKEWPANDSSMSLEDARFSVIRYFASDISNAYGPEIHDPRSGEILESHIGWYHNVMKLVHDWYMIQCAVTDPRARKMEFDEELMGDLIRFVSSHEVGHTLGLRHNMGSSSKTPVEKLRDKKWVEANGHTASIMDYARFNYVAQPEDSIGITGLYPRIGDYDRWAIEWGYKILPVSKDEKADDKFLNKITIERLAANPRLWFGGEGGNTDARAQTEDLGDNAMLASAYGIKNLQRLILKLPEWTKEEGDHYENLTQMYGGVLQQFQRYMGHVTKNIGGVNETFKTVEQSGNIYEPATKATQKEAVIFLNKQLFQTPVWLLDKNLLNKISSPLTENISDVQDRILGSILSATRLQRMIVAGNRADNSYRIDELITDLKNGIWSELKTNSAIDVYRRNLQKSFVTKLTDMISSTKTSDVSNPFAAFFGPVADASKSDIQSVCRAELISLRAQIKIALLSQKDAMSKYHLQDVEYRISKALDPKG